MTSARSTPSHSDALQRLADEIDNFSLEGMDISTQSSMALNNLLGRAADALRAAPPTTASGMTAREALRVAVNIISKHVVATQDQADLLNYVVHEIRALRDSLPQESAVNDTPLMALCSRGGYCKFEPPCAGACKDDALRSETQRAQCSEAEGLLGEAVMLMLQSGNADCLEFAQRIPVEFKSRDGAPCAALRADGGTAKVPEGWRLAPVKPTPEMFRAFVDVSMDMVVTANQFKYGYEAMLAAAPSPNGDDHEGLK